MTRVAAVDIGTNSVRLLVAEAEGSGDGAKLTQIDRRTRITRLGQGVNDTRRLDPEAIERTITVLREYSEAIAAHGVERVRATATSASRDATNREDFFEPAEQLLGVRPELISGDEEARLEFAGATTGLFEPEPFLVVDVGGGSTEFTVGSAVPEGLISVDVGCVRLTEQFLHSDPPSPEELSVAVSVVRDHLADVDREVSGAGTAKTLIGTAGTAWTMGAIELGVDATESERIHHFRLSRAAAEEIFRTLATEPIERRRHNPGLEPGRVDVIVGGVIVIVSVMRHWAFDEMLISETDILDGIARSIVVISAKSGEIVTHPARLLLGPGPSNPFPEVMEAFQRPVLGHLDPDFLVVLDEIGDRLRTVFRTKNALTLPMSGTGSAGMETCFVNLVEPGDPVIIGVNGVFGERMCEVARRCGAEVVRVDSPWGRAIDPQRLIEEHGRHPEARLLAVVHAETSTGVENDVAPLGVLRDTDTLLLVDMVTSLGGVPVEVDGWGIDAVYSGTQKCLGVPPGLSPVTFSDRVVERIRGRGNPPQSWYLDLGLIADYVGTARRYHHTAPISMLYALHAGLGVLIEEGLEASWARHVYVGEQLQAALPELGFRLFAEERRLPQLTSVWLPDGVDDAKVRGELLRRFDIEVGGGLGELAGKGWRIGLMGHGAGEQSVAALLGALRELL